MFKESEKKVCMLCTDVAARGIDIPEVDWVIQFDCPDTLDTYVHRAGRTARYKSRGKSLLFLLPGETDVFLDKHV